MDRLNKLAGPTIIELAQQRQFRREQQERELGLAGPIVDADPLGSESHARPVALPPVEQAKFPPRKSRSLPQLPPPTDMLSAPQPTPMVSCSQCQDRGYLRTNVPVGHPQFGKLVACKCKQARVNEGRRQQLIAQSKIEQLAAFQEETFVSFQFWLPGVRQAYEEAMRFAETPVGWLVLAGNNGCGKTHLAVAIAKRCLEDGHTVLFAVVPDLLDRLRSAFAPTAEETFDEEFAKMREVEVLILDDLGAESSTSWATEKLFQLLNYRYNARLATVFTTNKIGFEGIAPRLRSRLSDRRLVRTVTLTDAQDFREVELGQ